MGQLARLEPQTARSGLFLKPRTRAIKLEFRSCAGQGLFQRVSQETCMTEILVTCTDCGTTLKVSGESPDGRFVRCPQCTTIFIATKLERTPSAGSSGPRLTCTDCGAIQYAVQPIAGGKFVRCMDCGSVFRVPGPPVTAPAARLPAPLEPPRPAAVP